VHWVRLRRDNNEADSREQIKHKKRKKGDGHDMDVEKEEKVSKKKKMIFIFRVGIVKGNLFSVLLTSLIIIYMRFTPALQLSF
jgi:hypothetical protein